MTDVIKSLPFIALTFICWGVYGPVLHEGQNLMGGSRLRPLLCVGMAYFVIAVIVPIAMLYTIGEKGEWSFTGVFWSSLAGAAGAIGALGIILALSVGGHPSYVMPMVFGFAPIFNTLYTVVRKNLWGEVSPIFIAGIIVTIAGAVTVLIFAPKPKTQAKAPAAAVASADVPSPDEPH